MLVRSDPPQKSVDVLARELTDAVQDGRLAKYLDQPIRSNRLTASAPHAFLIIDAKDIPADDLTPFDARLAGWRYLLEVNHRPVAIATTAIDDDGAHHFEGITTGPAVSVVVYAVHVADELLKRRSSPFKMVAVDVPALHTVFLQLADAEGADPAFLPVGLATSLHPAHFYSRAQFRAELRRLAAHVETGPMQGTPVGR
jgi:hypothetical protein